MLGSPILYPKGMRIMMFQLSGFYCRGSGFGALWISEFRGSGLWNLAVGLQEGMWEFSKIGVLFFWGGVLIIRILLFRVLY